ncbi:hypothetical protein [Cyanobacterium sp. Dongsha4]|uniref:hypothetical protein n=1 Tax=Cyanobacterium sp. DS4 TaxID=2878255 RepID=UPI002E80126B|nr:hypothetical protein [Cyanobacterium sp. Dongsha4]WVL00233.1 hypothetical protein Dongsha4_16505 [Cyanobacterium sp. Dongsha4]
MNIDTLKNQIRYLTNQEGKPTDVLIPLTIWESIIEKLNLEITEENDSKAQLIADFKQSLIDAKEGKTYPLEELWEGID